MTTNPIDLIPADADCTALMLDLIRDATNEITESLPYLADRFDMISDYDDYLPAAAALLAATTNRFFAHIDDTPRDALAALLADNDFILDLATIDFSTSLHDYIDPEMIWDRNYRADHSHNINDTMTLCADLPHCPSLCSCPPNDCPATR